MAAKKPKPTAGLHNFAGLVKDVKGRIQAAQSRSLLAVNAELVRLYWDIGRIINDRQQQEGWGAAVIPRLAATLRNELPDLRGFSERNIGLMISFARIPTTGCNFATASCKISPSVICATGGRTIT